MDSFWDFFWFVLSFFLLMAYLVVLFHILTDLFRDRGTSGWIKAVWVLFLILLPLLTSLIYLIVRGAGMSERDRAAMQQAQRETDDYIRTVAGASPADQIHRAKELLDAGAITPAEFETLKSKALS